MSGGKDDIWNCVFSYSDYVSFSLLICSNKYLQLWVVSAVDLCGTRHVFSLLPVSVLYEINGVKKYMIEWREGGGQDWYQPKDF